MSTTTSFWGDGTEELHSDPEQVKRQRSATNIYLDPNWLDTETSTCRIKDYAVSLDSCTCMDFQRRLQRKREMPCKHMYRLAHELGMFNLDSVPQCPIPTQKRSDRLQYDNYATARPPDHNEQFFDGFAWAIPKAFAPALASCRFEQGDVLYDSRLAYDPHPVNGQGKPWRECVKLVSHSIQIKFPARGSVPLPENTIDVNEVDQIKSPSLSTFRKNWGYSVSFILTDHNTNESRLVATTQGRLYTMLRTGDLAWIRTDSADPAMPLQSSDLLRALKRYSKEAVPQDGHIVFLMPYDPLSPIQYWKRLTVSRALDRAFKFACPVCECLIAPNEINIPSASYYAPTIRIARFDIIDAKFNDVLSVLKRALYKQTGKKDCFRISSHGCLIHGHYV